jgi:phosphohistidine phosphatase SixA
LFEQVQTAECVAKVLTAAGCNVSLMEATTELSPNADPALSAAMLKDPVPLTVVVGHLPHLNLLASTLGSVVAESAFTPGGGVVLEQIEGTWALVHVVAHRTNWWIQGASSYTPADSESVD